MAVHERPELGRRPIPGRPKLPVLHQQRCRLGNLRENIDPGIAPEVLWRGGRERGSRVFLGRRVRAGEIAKGGGARGTAGITLAAAVTLATYMNFIDPATVTVGKSKVAAAGVGTTIAPTSGAPGAPKGGPGASGA
jgi:hypothetical protein